MKKIFRKILLTLTILIFIFSGTGMQTKEAQALSSSWDMNIPAEYTLSNTSFLKIDFGIGILRHIFTLYQIPGDSGNTMDAEFFDVEGDGDIDIFSINTNGQQNRIQINNGAGVFLSSVVGGGNQSEGSTSGDIDGDGDIDIYVANWMFQQNSLLLNDGFGNFISSNIIGDTGVSEGATMGDIDGDGDMDIYVANDPMLPNKLWINDGLGNGGASFTDSDIPGDTSDAVHSSMGDIDGDGDIDIYVAHSSGQNKLWINDGLGNGGASFTASDIIGDNLDSYGAITVDIDGDGDIDIYTLNMSGDQNKLWINDGLGNGGASFTTSDIVGDISSVASYSEPSFGDIDNDGDIDLISGRLWINDGLGNGGLSFHLNDNFNSGTSTSLFTGDLDGNGYVDIYVPIDNNGQNNLFFNEFSQSNPYLIPNIPITFTKQVESFIETLGANNEGTLSYQVSTDNGATWNYWNGAWTPTVLTDGTETSPASDINTNIETLDTDGGDFTWRAYLNSNGDQRVELDQINITFDSPPSPDGKTGSINYVCQDTMATNYNPSQFSRHKQSMCEYEEVETTLDTTECPHFTKYFRFGDKDNEIMKLQTFLQEQGFNTGYIDSTMGPITFNSVKEFQNKYSNEILKPWNLSKATGRWYQSTRHKANELAGCSEGELRLDNGVVIDD